jgi:lysophospholipase L1-like esterase
LLICAGVLGACSAPLLTTTTPAETVGASSGPTVPLATSGPVGAGEGYPWQAAVRGDDPPWLATHEALAQSVPGSHPGVLFVGDSILFAWPSTGAASWSLFAPWRPADIGVAGDTTQNVLWRIDHGEVARIDPKVTVVMIGTNDLTQYSAGQVTRGIEAVVSDLRRRLPLSHGVLLGVLPIDPPGTARHRSQPEIDGALAEEYASSPVRFIDLSAYFVEPSGALRASLYRPVCLTGTDFCDTLVHPSGAGYAVMAQVVAPVLRSLFG